MKFNLETPPPLPLQWIQLMPKKSLFRVLLTLGLISLLILVLWRAYTAIHLAANLFNDPDFEANDLSAWKVVVVGEAQVAAKPAAETPGNTILELKLPASPTANSGVGVGQRLSIEPRQRYKLAVNYRFPQATLETPTLLLRISQFDSQGQLIQQDEILNSQPQADSSEWQILSHNLITAKQAVMVETGIGVFGNTAALVEVDHFTFQPYPTWLSALRHDRLAWVAFFLIIGFLGYGAARRLWPFRRRLFLNGGVAILSLILTFIAVEMMVGFLPIQIIRTNWPRGYFVPLKDGQGYRLAKNYPRTVITNQAGTENVIAGNSLGVRDIEVPPGAGEMTLVLALGDSMTFGEAGDLHESWPRRLDEQIAELKGGQDNYHFINGGVSGYNTFQEVALLPELLEDMEQQGVKPQFVLLSFFSGIWERNSYGPEGSFTTMQDILMYSAFKQAILDMPARLTGQSQYDDLKLLNVERVEPLHQFLIYKSRTYFTLSLLLSLRFDKAWRERPQVDPDPFNEEALRLFKQVAQVYNVQPVVVYLPGYEMFEAPGENKRLTEKLSSLCEELGLVFIDPYENMEKLGINGDNAKEKLTLIQDAHYSVEGNIIYAKALAPLMIDYFRQD